MAATWRAFCSSTSRMRSAMARVGQRQENWIWLKVGARLSEVACPATRMNSLSVHVPRCGSMDAFGYLVVVYGGRTASSAAGARAVVWELFVPSRLPALPHVWGSRHSNV